MSRRRRGRKTRKTGRGDRTGKVTEVKVVRSPTAYCIDIDPHTPCIYERLSKTLRRDGMYTSCVVGQPH